MHSTPQTRLREILYDLDDFIKHIPNERYHEILLSFHRKVNGNFTTEQAKLFFPLDDRILIWEGPAETFLTFDDKEIAKFQAEQVEYVAGKLGFEPRRGRYE